MMGLLSGVVIGVIGIISFGLSVGLRDKLSAGLNQWLGLGEGLGLSYNPLFGLIYDAGRLAVGGGLLVWAIMGGLAVLRNAVLRLLLWRSHTFPWHAASFLEDAQARILVQCVGGGYRFIHRLLLDYFADLQVVTSAPSPPTTPPP